MSVYLITFAFIVTDYLTGICKAWATKAFSSGIMRAGLWHKLALLFAMCIGWLADYAQKLVDIGMQAPVGAAVCVYIITMELVSSLENICQMNPDIVPDALLALFGGRIQQQRAKLLKAAEKEGGENGTA